MFRLTGVLLSQVTGYWESLVTRFVNENKNKLFIHFVLLTQDQPVDHWPNIVSILLDRVSELNSMERIVYFFDNVSVLWTYSNFWLSLSTICYYVLKSVCIPCFWCVRIRISTEYYELTRKYKRYARKPIKMGSIETLEDGNRNCQIAILCGSRPLSHFSERVASA